MKDVVERQEMLVAPWNLIGTSPSRVSAPSDNVT